MDNLDAATGSTAENHGAQLRRELAPVGLLQTFLVGQVALGMARLAAVDVREDAEAGGPAWTRDHARAERSFYRSLAEFRRQVKADAKSARDTAQTPTPDAESAVPRPTAVDAGGPRPDLGSNGRPSPQPSPGVPGEGVKIGRQCADLASAGVSTRTSVPSPIAPLALKTT